MRDLELFCCQEGMEPLGDYELTRVSVTAYAGAAGLDLVFVISGSVRLDPRSSTESAVSKMTYIASNEQVPSPVTVRRVVGFMEGMVDELVAAYREAEELRADGARGLAQRGLA